MKKEILFVTGLTLLLHGCFTTRYPVTDDTPRLSENDFDVKAYKPFKNENKIAVLDEISTLKFDNDLPVIDGATALYPLYSAFVQAVYPNKNYKTSNSNVRCNNTMTAYYSLIQRNVDIIFVARPSKKQIAYAEQQEVQLQFTPIAKEAFVFFVNSNNKVDDLTIDQIQDIYSGKITNWKEIGGNDEKIIPFQRNEGSGSQTAFVNFMNGKEIIKPQGDEKLYGMGIILARVADYANYANSIGFSFRFFTNEMVKNEQIKILKINGIYPDIHSINNNSYPLVSEFYAVTIQNAHKPNVERFLEWIKSKQGQELIEKTGYCAIHKN